MMERFTGKKVHGEGTAVEVLRNAGISVFNENELKEAASFLEVLESEENMTETVEKSIVRRSGIMRGTIR